MRRLPMTFLTLLALWLGATVPGRVAPREPGAWAIGEPGPAIGVVVAPHRAQLTVPAVRRVAARLASISAFDAEPACVAAHAGRASLRPVDAAPLGESQRAALTYYATAPPRATVL